MSEPASNQHGDVSDPRILWIAWPREYWRSWAIATLTLAALLLMGIPAIAAWPEYPTPVFIFAFTLFLAAGVMKIRTNLRWSRDDREASAAFARMMDENRHHGDALDASLYLRVMLRRTRSCLHRTQFIPTSIRAATALRTEIASCGGIVPVTVVEDALQAELEPIPRPEALLEPEPVTTLRNKTSNLGLVLVVITIVCVGTFLFSIGMRRIIGFAFLALMVPPLLAVAESRGFRVWPAESFAPFAGPGVVTHRNRRWTVDDSIMFVQKTDRGIRVQFDGPSGSLLLRFHSEKAPGFITLWQRWNHPQPRPELLT